MPLPIGTRFGSYEILGPLGAGGMGEVYRASDTRLKRQVAIKILPGSVSSANEGSASDRLARFQREAEVLASLNHPHVAAVYGLEDVPANVGAGTALVMELVEGPTLADRIARAPIPIDEAMSIARQIAEALEVAHAQGIVHRDLKPANIKVRDDGTVKVLDFGLAKLAESKAIRSDDSPTITSDAMTQMGAVLGTPAYMSPEQARGKPVDKGTDIWGFGAVLYEMLTRRRAFGGEDVAETIANVMKGTPDWAALSADVPPQVVTLVRRCLDKDRRARIGDIAVAHFLLSEHATFVGSSPEAVPMPVPRTPPPAWRRALPWTIAAAAVLGASAVAFMWLGGRTGSTPAPTATRFVATLPAGVELRSTQTATMLSVSPDGKRVAFAASRDGANQIWVRTLDAVDPVPLAGTEGGSQAFWSPDGSSLGYSAAGQLKALDMSTGRVTTVCDPSTFAGGAWNGDGIIVFGGTVGGIFKVPAAGGDPVRITTPDASRGESAHRFPSFLPDGRRFVYLAFPAKTLWVGSLDGGMPARLATADSQAQYAAPGYLLFARGSTLLAQAFEAGSATLSGTATAIAQDPVIDINGSAAFSVSGGGTLVVRTGLASPPTQLTWSDRLGRALGVIGQPGRYRNPTLSPDGTRIAVEVLELNRRTQDVWIVNSTNGESSRFTFDAANDIWPVWSPDGGRIVFASDREEGKTNLYVRPSDGSSAEGVLLELGAEKLAAPISWSPDGELIVFRHFAPFSNMAVLSIDDRQSRMFHQVGFTQAQGQVSPNGKWLAYHSTEAGGNHVYVESFPTGTAKWQVSADAGVYPRWSRDGRELYYYGVNGRMTAVSVSGEAALVIGPPTPLFDPRTLNGSNVGVGFRAQYDVTRDGRFLLNVPVGDPPASPIHVVLNWTAAIGK